MMKRNIKRILSATLAFAIAASGFVLSSKQTQAADVEIVKYEVVQYDIFEAAINSKTAPETAGYLFGGWYKYDSASKKGTPITSVNDVTAEDTIAAKYVSIDMSRIAFQLNLDKNNRTRDMRIVSLVDSTNYSAVGFNVYGRKNNDPVGEEWLMYSYNSDSKAQSTKVYAGLKVYSDEENYDVKYPSDVFGSDAEGFKFTTMLLQGVPDSDYDTIVSIRPYWITKDGTYVEGMGEFNRVDDYNDGIVNISVNLKQATSIAAGLLEVTYTDAFQYVGADYGCVFEDMEIVNLKTGSIRCVGIVRDTAKNSENPNEVYVNLRFRKTDTNLKVGTSLFTVTVPERGFYTIDEKEAEVYAPSIKY